jgi:hypothetical protein
VSEASIGGGDFSDVNDMKQAYCAGSDVVFAY